MSPVFGQDTLDFISHSEAQTRRLGARLAALLNPGDVLALTGELGTGKTRWVQGVCQGQKKSQIQSARGSEGPEPRVTKVGREPPENRGS